MRELHFQHGPINFSVGPQPRGAPIGWMLASLAIEKVSKTIMPWFGSLLSAVLR